jgi:hypothetical protein
MRCLVLLIGCGLGDLQFPSPRRTSSSFGIQLGFKFTDLGRGSFALLLGRSPHLGDQARVALTLAFQARTDFSDPRQGRFSFGVERGLEFADAGNQKRTLLDAG